MNILLISDAYPPEVRSASRLMYEFARSMADRGNSVTVITAYPEYNIPEGGRTKFNTVEIEDGIKIIRISTLKFHLVGMIQRGIGILMLPYFFIKAGIKYVDSHVDIVLVYSPPLPLAFAGSILARKFKAKCVLNIQDIFPQNAIDLGIMKNVLLIRFFELIEKYAYRFSDFVTVHSEGNYCVLSDQKNVDGHKLGVFHNWVNLEDRGSSGEKNNDFRSKFNLNDKFIILFGGVIGPAQGLDIVISAAEHLQETNVCFFLAGDGTEKKRLEALANNKNLTNVIFHPFLNFDEYIEILNASDAGLVTLHKEMKTPVVPGKLVQYMAHGKPVIASLNPESDGIQIINEGKCGYVCNAGDGIRMAENIRKMIDSYDQLSEMGKSGYRYVKQHMTRESVMNQYLELFKSLLK